MVCPDLNAIYFPSADDTAKVSMDGRTAQEEGGHRYQDMTGDG